MQVRRVDGMARLKRPGASGAALERRVKARLERSGWTVIRSAGSRGVCDLVAMRPAFVSYPRVAFLQCKKPGRISTQETAALERAAIKAGVVECYIVRGDMMARDWSENLWRPIEEWL